MSIGTLLLTLFTGTFVGEDEQGNKYYRDKRRFRHGKEKRWVVYGGDVEASSVPAEWHGWLHHRTEALPGNEARQNKDWQKPHEANLTGTPKAYRPPGHMLKEGRRDRATGDYESWQPDQ
ncbi:MAG: NADH:ubiquinone oxidoreductase subunit NDUFA12 [Rhodospirillaceae bacterium]|nr:NADH:ubiquinone oxidoreductase subunit NDUFA12 [Rhodospirillaceae bacterium]|tara:strand:- start:6802 stop:7161 length:360 start_codon:yes stop_codon:yes gene_type:complete